MEYGTKQPLLCCTVVSCDAYRPVGHVSGPAPPLWSEAGIFMQPRLPPICHVKMMSLESFRHHRPPTTSHRQRDDPTGRPKIDGTCFEPRPPSRISPTLLHVFEIPFTHHIPFIHPCVVSFPSIRSYLCIFASASSTESGTTGTTGTTTLDQVGAPPSLQLSPTHHTRA